MKAGSKDRENRNIIVRNPASTDSAEGQRTLAQEGDSWIQGMEVKTKLDRAFMKSEKMNNRLVVQTIKNV